MVSKFQNAEVKLSGGQEPSHLQTYPHIGGQFWNFLLQNLSQTHQLKQSG